MNLRWGIFAPCMNEATVIEAKIKWGLRLFDDVVILEGHHPQYTDHGENHLSNDGTTEILKSYADQITYIPFGEAQNEIILRNEAYKALKKDLDVVIMSDIDEFILEKDLEYIDMLYQRNKDLKLTLTNSYIFLDKEYCAPHIRRKQSPPMAFSKDLNIHFGEWHERIFRYNKYYSYLVSPFLVNDLYGRFIFNDPYYFNERQLLSDVYILHYKNFKMDEAKKRLEMYNEYGDGVKHDDEFQQLEKDKIKYEGEHPKEIGDLLRDIK